MDVLCTFKIKIESQNLDHGCIKNQWPYPNQDQGAKPQWEIFRSHQCPKLGLKGHGCSMHLKNQERYQNLEHECIKDQWPYPNQSRCITQVSNLQHLPMLTKWMPYRTCIFYAPLNSTWRAKIRLWTIFKSWSIQSGLRGHGFSLHHLQI